MAAPGMNVPARKYSSSSRVLRLVLRAMTYAAGPVSTMQRMSTTITIDAASSRGIEDILIGGGVAANSRLRAMAEEGAAARGIRLTEVRSRITGDIDLKGILGLDPAVRNGFRNIAVRFTVKGDAPADVLRALVEQSRRRSAVFDVLTNQVPIPVDVATPE